MIYLISVVFALAASGVEAVSYSGWVLSHVGIRASYLYAVSIFLSLYPVSYAPTLKRIALALAYAVAIIYLALICLETITYPNFVFTHTHLNPTTLQFFMALLWFHALSLSKQKLYKSLLVAILIYVGIDGAGRTLGIMYKGVRDMVSAPFATYDQKMTKAYPGFYPAMQEVARVTPQDATILIPPQGNPWEMEGNAAIVNYFLYPRRVHNLDPNTVANQGVNTYLLIAKGSWQRIGEVDYGWPKVAVGAKKLWHFDTDSGITSEFIRDYSPATDTWNWGLIEVTHE